MTQNPSREEIVGLCEAVVGPGNVLYDRAERYVYGYDASVFRGTDVMAVVFPETAEQVSRIVRISREAGLAVVARGAGTGINGGALPQGEPLIIALARMNRIIEVDTANQVAVVQPGVVNQELKAHLGSLGFGFTYVPDPGSQVVSTLGGNVGNNAGGMHCLKYGVTANHILGLEVVLPDGEIVRLGAKFPGAPGFDLVGLFVGSEGTLGIVTEITVRILPLPEKTVTQLALFPDVTSAAEAVSGIMAAGILPAALELLDRKIMLLVDRFLQIGYPEEAGASLIIELDGLAEGMEGEMRRVAEICTAHRAMAIETATTPEEAERLWLSRRAAYGSVARISPTVYVIDGCVPRNLLAEAIRRVVEICERRGLDVVTVAHAGDGNIHPLIPFNRDDPRSREQALAAHREVMEMCVALGGSITGEHGVGVEKQGEMGLMYSGDELEAMFAVKRALDPDLRFNPRKIFPLEFFEKMPVAGEPPRRAGQGSK
ncbi:MAG: FAD-binding protein, partial [SAR324 cluster bacterium]|nr:FAD-binding protein [SAR324 cluster bacterium]